MSEVKSASPGRGPETVIWVQAGVIPSDRVQISLKSR